MIKKIKEAVKIVATEEIMPHFSKGKFDVKSDGSLQTPADLASQEKLQSILQDIYPAPFLGEEMSTFEQKRLLSSANEFLWCVDPIDGTSNYVNGIPYFAVSVALMKEGRTLIGVVYDPARQEMFSAEVGRGAYLNGVKLPQCVNEKSLDHAIAQIDFKRLPSKMSEVLLMTPPYKSQRNFGAGALEWCYLASGRFDIYIHGSQKIWDYAAGSLILSESGGCLRTLGYEDFWQDPSWSKSVVAANRAEMFDTWVDWLKNTNPRIIQ